MRRFVVVGHRAMTSPDFSLNDLAGSTGRLDVLLRCINSSFVLSNGMRKDVELYLVLQGEPDPPKTLHLVGCELRYLNPDERSTAALVRNALVKAEKGQWGKSTPGIYIYRKGFEDVLAECAGQSGIIYLKEDGEPISGALESVDSISRLGSNLDDAASGWAGDLTFVLGDDKDLTDDEEELLKTHAPVTVSLGPEALHSDHCIILVQNELDREK
jgi:tRNA (pseudouridine54-N1)-methyltransferase